MIVATEFQEITVDDSPLRLFVAAPKTEAARKFPGIIGFRALRLAELQSGDTLAIYGFGAAGHVCIQVARYWGIRVVVSTREEKHRKLADRTWRRVGWRRVR